jgi:hypothetical protein
MGGGEAATVQVSPPLSSEHRTTAHPAIGDGRKGSPTRARHFIVETVERKFWSADALVWGSEKVVADIETTVCPW